LSRQRNPQRSFADAGGSHNGYQRGGFLFWIIHFRNYDHRQSVLKPVKLTYIKYMQYFLKRKFEESREK